MSTGIKIGIVCPYGWDIPGGVQIHIKELAEYFIAQGHEVSVIAPVADEDANYEPWLVSAGRPVPIPFNGSVARVLFGPIASSRVKQWLAQGEFDVIHLHEPGIPSLSFLACWAAEGAMVGTFHASTPKMRAISSVSQLIEPMIEKLSARIAVSNMAQRTLNELYGTEAVVIPNGIDCAKFTDAATRNADRFTDANRKRRIGFLGRFEEPRKGLPLLIAAMPKILKAHPNLELVIAGPGDPNRVLANLDPALKPHLKFLGKVSEAEKVEFLASLDLYVAPNTGGESFGIILAEAMAAGAPVLASDIPAFVDLLTIAQGETVGSVGETFTNEDAADLAKKAISMLGDRSKLQRLAEKGRDSAIRFDWTNVATQIMSVYELAMSSYGKVTVGSERSTRRRG